MQSKRSKQKEETYLVRLDRQTYEEAHKVAARLALKSGRRCTLCEAVRHAFRGLRRRPKPTARPEKVAIAPERPRREGPSPEPAANGRFRREIH
jgi:hypothetical protein